VDDKVLKLNDDKTEVLAIGSKGQLAKIDILQLQICDVLIKKSTKPQQHWFTLQKAGTENVAMWGKNLAGKCLMRLRSDFRPILKPPTLMFNQANPETNEEGKEVVKDIEMVDMVNHNQA
jgi:hypothetical protein